MFSVTFGLNRSQKNYRVCQWQDAERVVCVLKHEFGSCFPGSTGGTGIRELSTVLKLYPTMPVMRYIANLALSALFWDMARHEQGAISGNLTSQNICRKSWAVIGRRQHGPLIG